MGHEGAAFVDLLEAEAADWSAMLGAEELHHLVMDSADTLQQVADRLTQLVETKVWVFPVRAQVLLTERGHAGKAGLRCFCFHAGITAYDFLFLGLALLFGRAGLALGRPQVEGLHHGAEDRVLLQLGFGSEVGPTLRAAVGLLPGGEEAVLAEVVSAGDGHRTVKGTQTDAAGQLILQTQQRKLTLVHFGHDVTSGEAAREKRNLTSFVSNLICLELQVNNIFHAAVLLNDNSPLVTITFLCQ